MDMILESPAQVSVSAPCVDTPCVATPDGNAAGQARYDIYAGVHKGLRAMMAHTLVQLGSVDTTERYDVAQALRQTRSLLSLCRLHLHDENTFVHPALERITKGASKRISDEHVEHERDIDALAHQVATIETRLEQPGSTHTDLAQPVGKLYLNLSTFIAHNFEHMAIEEARHNEILWSALSDQALLDIEHAIVASIAPEMMGVLLRWIVPSLNHAQRVAMLTDMRCGAPAEVFNGVLQMTSGLIPADQWEKLSRALGLRTT